MRILGIDPGSAVTGYGVVERIDGRLSHVAHGTMRLSSDLSLPQRLDQLYRTVTDVLAGHAPDCAAVETVFVAASPRSALVLGQARGAILAALAAGGMPVNEYAPARIKRAVTGNGRATKQQVKLMVKRLLALDRVPASDAADALAAAIAHANASRIEALAPALADRRRRRPTSRGTAFNVRRPQ
jgi:crossover junction endodeoxyribonuclease RuvC